MWKFQNSGDFRKIRPRYAQWQRTRIFEKMPLYRQPLAINTGPVITSALKIRDKDLKMTPLPQKVENSTLFFEPSPYTEILFQQIIISRICVGVKKWLCRWSKTVGYWTSEINKVIHFIIRKGFKKIWNLIHNIQMYKLNFLCRCLVRK